ncbi:MAG: MBL fold metallo-hydrolase [Acidobacteriota bacterium]|nr:MBL fold metallo-hydrolase [Acidobacteriota bacterium]MDH3786360.1 MBL fold metallo-hydrolase [Acidobacteriota bacterium]
MTRFTVGELDVTMLDAGHVLLDGGAMFGVVPKVLWERERSPDDKNRITLALNLMLIDDGKQKILVDTGAGDKAKEKTRSIYGLSGLGASDLLAPVGLRPDDIDLVINTHLHFDHAGGNTAFDSSGELVPAFSNARYVVQQREIDAVRWDHPRMKTAYVQDDFRTLLDDPDRLQVVEGPHDLGNGIELVPAPGHTQGSQRVDLREGNARWSYVADLIPTASHLRPNYVMSFDVEPLITIETKMALVAEAARENWKIIFEHDTDYTVITLEETANGVRPLPVDLES